MNPSTYGKSPAALKLSEIVEQLNNKPLQSKIGRTLNMFYEGVRSIEQIKVQAVRKTLMTMWRDRYYAYIDETFRDNIKTFMLNVVSAEYKRSYQKAV